MLTWRLSYRNLFRHKTRLALNLCLLVGAFSAIVLFKGFKQYVLDMMKENKIETQYGHIEVAKNKFWNNAPVDQVSEKMLQSPKELAAAVAQMPEVQFASARLSFYGLINTEDKSMPAQFIGFDPKVESKMQSHLLLTDGVAFQDSKSAIVGKGLAQLLKIKAGSDVTIVSPTLNGGINAMDIHVNGIFSTGFTDIDNSAVFLPLQDGEKILDTEQADQLIIKLKDEKDINDVVGKIKQLKTEDGVQVKHWYDLADLYNQVKDFYNFQNAVIEFILIALLVLSVSNTTNMTIFERLSEIGTLRALGDYESDVQKLFILESLFLGALAVIVGIPVSYILVQIVSGLHIPIVLPFTSRAIPMTMVPTTWAYVEAALVCFFSVILASLWPAKKGAATSIVTALRAKI